VWHAEAPGEALLSTVSATLLCHSFGCELWPMKTRPERDTLTPLREQQDLGKRSAKAAWPKQASSSAGTRHVLHRTTFTNVPRTGPVVVFGGRHPALRPSLSL
jgi:hypothetical protein